MRKTERSRGSKRRRYARGGGAVRQALVRLTSLGAAVIALATVLALFAERWWIAELFTHFRAQYLAAGAVLLVIGLALRRRLVAVAMLAGIAVNAIPVIGYLPLAAARSAPTAGTIDDRRDADALGRAGDRDGGGPRALRIVTTNVLVENPDASALIALVREVRPDVFVVLELSPAFEAGLEALDGEYPYSVARTSDDPFGIGLYSRLPLLNAAVIPLGATNAVRASVETATGTVDLLGVHLLPPVNALWAAERNGQLLRIAELVHDSEAAPVVCGDFNMTPYSPYFRRLLASTGLQDARRRHGPGWTWPAGFAPLAVAIDHCLSGEETNVNGIEVLGDIGSDHYPLLIDITAGRNG